MNFSRHRCSPLPGPTPNPAVGEWTQFDVAATTYPLNVVVALLMDTEGLVPIRYRRGRQITADASHCGMLGRTMKIVTWNINGARARIANLVHWLTESRPDIVCLQEIKSEDHTFPRLEIEALGYNVETHGQKGFNGVAILSKLPFDEVNRRLPGDESDEQARFIEGVFSTGGGALRVVSLYLPNGNPVGTEKFPYKLAWMARLESWARERLKLEEPLVLAGDYNVIPERIDARTPDNWLGDALFQPETRQAYRRLINLGFTEALRATTADAGVYTFWDYQAGAWQKNNGIRIDHLLLSPEAANRLASASVEKHVRAWEKPSDHVPVAIELDMEKQLA
jgi:exodeoxyribonuclease-3